MNQRPHREHVNQATKLLYVINVDWYFVLHWLDRAKAARDNGYEVHIATHCTSNEHRQLLVDEGFILHEVPFKRSNLNPITEITTFLRLRRVLKVVNPQLLHCITLKPVFLGGLANRKQASPCIYSLPGLGGLFTSKHPLSKVAWHIIELTLPLALSQANSITLFENQHDRSILTGNGVVMHRNTRVLPGAGVNPEKFTFSPEPASEVLRILFAARLLHSKGLPLLIAAVGNLYQKGLNITLDVAGIIDNDSRDSISAQQIHRWRKLDYINWLGELPSVVEAIHNSHITCLPTSYGEGIPRVLIEAAACGRPVITTDVPGCNEFVQHEIDGLLVPTGDIDQLADAIAQLASDPERRAKMGLAGRKKVLKSYSNQTVISRTIDIYKELSPS